MSLNRDERQDLGIEKWKKAGGRATMEYATGFGKTRVALKTIKRLVDKKPDCKVIVIVPTDYLKEQWMLQVTEWMLFDNCRVIVINTAVKMKIDCDLLVIDEVHVCGAESFSKIFTCIAYKLLMCLTGTLDRLDGRQTYIKRFAPVCDIITFEEALANKWLSDYNEYKVLIEVDLAEYKQLNKQFIHHFSFFNFDFNLAMRCVKNIVSKRLYAKHLGCSEKDVTIQTMGFVRNMHAKNNFIKNHPMKVEVTNLILEHRQDKKCITFSAKNEVADQIKFGRAAHTGIRKAKRTSIIEEFRDAKIGTLNTAKALDVGADIPGLSVSVVLSGSSSSIQANQRKGRVTRKEGDNKIAEIFNLIVANTSEEEWFKTAKKDSKYLTITVAQLKLLLKGEDFETEKQPEQKFVFRF